MPQTAKIDMETRRQQQLPPVTKADIRAGLAAVGVAPGDTLWVHSSLSAFGYVEGGADTVLDAMLETLGPAGTLVLPTFAWGAFHAAQRAVFDVAHTPCETGRIPETFRQRPGVLRSPHICHSVAACGPHAAAVLGDGVHPFGQGSTFDALYRLDAWNLMLGVSFQSCTALHCAEELEQVPYRAYRDFKDCEVVLADGRRGVCAAVEFLRQDGSSNDFAKVEALFAAAGILRTSQVGAARLVNVRIREVIDRARQLLQRDVRFLSRNRI